MAWRQMACTAGTFHMITWPRVELCVGPREVRASGLTYTRPRRRRVQWGSAASRPNYKQNATACRRRPEIDIYSAGHRYRMVTAFTSSEQNYSFAQIRRHVELNSKSTGFIPKRSLLLRIHPVKDPCSAFAEGSQNFATYFGLSEKTLQCQIQAIPFQGKCQFA